MSDFIPTATISLERYEELKRNESILLKAMECITHKVTPRVGLFISPVSIANPNYIEVLIDPKIIDILKGINPFHVDNVTVKK